MVERYNESASGMFEDDYGQFVEYSDYAKLEADKELWKKAALAAEEEIQNMKDVIKRALEYRLEDVMRKSDIRKLKQVVEG